MPGMEEKIQSFLNRIPVFFADKDSVRTRSDDQHGFVIGRRFVKQAIELLASFTGIHAGHNISVRVRVCQDKLSRNPHPETTKKIGPFGLKMSHGPKVAQTLYNRISYLGRKIQRQVTLAELTRKRSEVRVFSIPPFFIPRTAPPEEKFRERSALSHWQV